MVIGSKILFREWSVISLLSFFNSKRRMLIANQNAKSFDGRVKNET